MPDLLDLDQNQLVDLTLRFAESVTEGLAAEGQQIRCLPSFIPVRKGYRDGWVRVLDLGGSNVRAGLVEVKHGRPILRRRSPAVAMPWQRHHPFERERYLQIQAEQLRFLDADGDLPLGYCFSYPARSLPDGDAALLRWTKDIDVPGTVGLPVGGLLRDYCNRHPESPRFGRVTVITDTVASLIAGLTLTPTDARIGLIVGTGMNMAAFFDPSLVPKLQLRPLPDYALPINLEAGNFRFSYRTGWDQCIDEASENPGAQWLEKAVSGAYLGRLLKAVVPEIDLDPELGALALVRLLNNPGSAAPSWLEAARRIYRRSAWLVAAGLAGLIKVLDKGPRPFSSVGISAEGSLFWGRLQGETQYFHMVRQTLETLLPLIGLRDIRCTFEQVEDANLIGAALAALSC